MQGSSWSVELLGWLYEQYKAGVPPYRLAEQAGRSINAVVAKLRAAGFSDARIKKGETYL